MFYFTKPEGLAFSAGQYVAMKLPRLVEPDKRGPARSLSIATAPSEQELGFGMRNTGSGFKKTLWSLKPGEQVDVTDAIGFFTLDPEEERTIVLLAGGIGITPVRSILKEAEARGSQQHFILFNANRAKKDAPFCEELGNLKLPHLQEICVLSKPSDMPETRTEEPGLITRELIEKYVDKIPDSVYYIVGSPQFIEAMEGILLSLGVTKEQWKVDPFTGLVSKPIE